MTIEPQNVGNLNAPTNYVTGSFQTHPPFAATTTVITTPQKLHINPKNKFYRPRTIYYQTRTGANFRPVHPELAMFLC